MMSLKGVPACIHRSPHTPEKETARLAMKLAIFIAFLSYAAAFAPQSTIHVSLKQPSSPSLGFRSTATAASTTTPTSSDEPSVITIDKKEAVKIFGRLAEKYIMLDDTAGKCCYSACADCEYRLPGGGYRMADQSAARPKWIPSYTERKANGNEHTTKWSAQIFRDGPAVSLPDFVERVVALEFAPPLGGPYVGASAAAIEDTTVVEHLFHLLVAEGKDVLTKHRMSLRLQELAGDDQGLNWSKFQNAIGA